MRCFYGNSAPSLWWGLLFNGANYRESLWLTLSRHVRLRSLPELLSWRFPLIQSETAINQQRLWVEFYYHHVPAVKVYGTSQAFPRCEAAVWTWCFQLASLGQEANPCVYSSWVQPCVVSTQPVMIFSQRVVSRLWSVFPNKTVPETRGIGLWQLMEKKQSRSQWEESSTTHHAK